MISTPGGIHTLPDPFSFNVEEKGVYHFGNFVMLHPVYDLPGGRRETTFTGSKDFNKS